MSEPGGKGFCVVGLVRMGRSWPTHVSGSLACVLGWRGGRGI